MCHCDVAHTTVATHDALHAMRLTRSMRLHPPLCGDGETKLLEQLALVHVAPLLFLRREHAGNLGRDGDVHTRRFPGDGVSGRYEGTEYRR